MEARRLVAEWLRVHGGSATVEHSGEVTVRYPDDNVFAEVFVRQWQFGVMADALATFADGYAVTDHAKRIEVSRKLYEVAPPGARPIGDRSGF